MANEYIPAEYGGGLTAGGAKGEFEDALDEMVASGEMTQAEAIAEFNKYYGKKRDPMGKRMGRPLNIEFDPNSDRGEIVDHFVMNLFNIDWGDTGKRSSGGNKISPVYFQRTLNDLYTLDEEGYGILDAEKIDLTGVLDLQTIEFTRKLLEEKYGNVEDADQMIDGIINKLVSTQSVESNLINEFQKSDNKNIMGE